jgi:hypothetical protein
MEGLLTVIRVEYLTGTGKQRLDVFPYPRGSIADDTKPHLIFRNHARFFDLRKGFATWRLIVHLMPAEQIDKALLIQQREAKALGIAPLAALRYLSGPRETLPRAALPGAVRRRGHVRPIEAQHQDRTAQAACRHLLNATRNGIA